MKPIFQHCDTWEICEHEGLRNLFEKKEIRGDKFELPNEHELNRLNEKCQGCKHALRIEKEECPICENKNLGPPSRYFGSGQHAVSPKEIYYRCDQCNRDLVSYGKLD